MITSKDFWNQRARVYDEQVEGMYQDAYDKTVSCALQFLSPTDRVLEFACGTGIVTVRVAPHVAHLQAIDIADEMAQRAREKVRSRQLSNAEVSQMDLFDPRLEAGSFDAVMGFNVLCYVDNFDQVMARIQTLLKPGGVFLSATDCLGQKLTPVGIRKFFKSRTGSMPYVAFYSMKSLERRVAGAGFDILRSENLFPAPPNLFLAAKKKDMV